MPSIVPISDLSLEHEDIFDAESTNINCVNALEAKIMLSQIISDNKILKLKLNTALGFSLFLEELFDDLTCNFLTIDTLNKLSLTDSPEHLEQIKSFLMLANNSWQKSLQKIKKLDRGNSTRINFDSQIQQANSTPVIIVGIFGHNLLTFEFLKKILSCSFGYVILPPIPCLEDKDLDNLEVHHPLQPLAHLLKTLEIDTNEIRDLNNPLHTSINCFDGLLFRKSVPIASEVRDLEYIEYQDCFLEAKNVIGMCEHLIQNQKVKKIAIALSDPNTVDIYKNLLIGRGIAFNNLMGELIIEEDVMQLLIELGVVLFGKFDLQNLFVLLKNPLIYSNEVLLAEEILCTKNRFIDSYQLLFQTINNSNDNELIKWWGEIINTLESNSKKDTKCFGALFQHTISIAQVLYKDLWRNVPDRVIEFINELSEASQNLIIEDNSEF